MDINNKKNKGFTLIELIVVMIIIGILVLLATPRFIRYIEKARYTNIINDTRVVENVVTAHLVKNNKMPKSSYLVDNDDLKEILKNNDSYFIDGKIIIDSNGPSNIKERVRELADVGYEITLNKDAFDNSSFYLMDEDYIRVETRSRLKGAFLVNKNGTGIYTTKPAEDFDTEMDEDGDFEEDVDLYCDVGSIIETDTYIYETTYCPLDDTGSNEMKDHEFKVNGFSSQYLSANQPGEREVVGMDLYTSTLNPGQTLKLNITKIEDSAFEQIGIDGKVHIPSSVKEVGRESFYQSINDGSHLESSVVGRVRELKLKEDNIPSKLETIGYRAFSSNGVVGELTIPSSVKEIGNDGFYGAGRTVAEDVRTGTVTEFNLQEPGKKTNLTEIGSSVFQNFGYAGDSLNIPSSIEKINSHAFATFGIYNRNGQLGNITQLNFSDEFGESKLRHIGKAAFDSAHMNLDKLTIPKSVETIEDSTQHVAVFGNNAFKKLEFEKGSQLRHIPEFMFAVGQKRNLLGVYEVVNFPENLESIGSSVFLYNRNLTGTLDNSDGRIQVDPNSFPGRTDFNYIPPSE